MPCRSLLCRLLICAVFGCCAALTTPAADKPASAPQVDPATEAMMKAATPGAMHEKLKPFVGTWKTTVKMFTGPGEPEVSEGTSTSEWVLGGRYVREMFQGTFAGMPFEGRGLTGYDNVSNEFVGVWVDNFGTGIVASTGKVDPSGKVFNWQSTSHNPVPGMPDTMRSVVEIVNDKTHKFTTYTMIDGKEVKQMEITYTR
jgi:uncharacterized protein DUF1579